MRKQIAWSAAIASLLLINVPAKVSAQDPEARKLTYLTFSAPVQLPGFELPAGTYRLTLADPDTSRNVIEVASQDGKRTYGLLLTIPDERTKPAKESIVLFNETPAGTPAAVRTWFYPGESTGYELVYPKDQAIKIARAAHQGVLATDSDIPKTGDRVKAFHGARIGHIDENGNFTSSDDTKATTGASSSKQKPTDTTSDQK